MINLWKFRQCSWQAWSEFSGNYKVNCQGSYKTYKTTVVKPLSLKTDVILSKNNGLHIELCIIHRASVTPCNNWSNFKRSIHLHSPKKKVCTRADTENLRKLKGSLYSWVMITSLAVWKVYMFKITLWLSNKIIALNGCTIRNHVHTCFPAMFSSLRKFSTEGDKNNVGGDIEHIYSILPFKSQLRRIYRRYR